MKAEKPIKASLEELLRIDSEGGKPSNFFERVDNFAKTAHVQSIPVFEAELNFVPKVTIAIPTYKRAHLLKEAVDSALNQVGYTNYDIIVVDNNSERNDDTEKLMSTYQNSRVSYYKNAENIQMFGNWNRLYTLAKGEWVVMLHDDDLLYDDYLRYMFEIIMPWCNHQYDIYFAPYHAFDLTRKLTKPYRTEHRFKAYKISVSDFCCAMGFAAPIGFCMRKNDVRELGGFRSDYYPLIDYDFYLRAVKSFNFVKITGYPLCIYRYLENESLKLETLIGGNIIVNSIIEALIRYKIKPKQWLLRIHKDVIAEKFVYDLKTRFPDLVDVAEELKRLGIKKNGFISKIIQRGVTYWLKIKFRLKRKTLRLPCHH